MAFDRLLGDVQALGDLAVGLAGGGQTGSPRPREAMTAMPIGREHITGRRAPVTSTAHRPGDWDEDEI